MILDMIPGCRYLRRSTDRWLLSKHSMTRLKDSKVGTGLVLLWNCSIPITNTKGLYSYPCPNMTPGRLRVQHSLPKLMSRRQCPSRTRHQFVPSLCPGHVIMYSRKLPFLSANSPSAKWWRTTDRKYLYLILWGEFPAEWRFFTKLFRYSQTSDNLDTLCNNTQSNLQASSANNTQCTW
jgi:hypothetical protein